MYFDVTRGDVPVSSVDVSYEVSKGIGYIKVSKFGRTTYNEFITAIAKLKQAGCTSFVIDLRGNTGGYMDAAINMVNEFMPEGRLIVYTEGKAFPAQRCLYERHRYLPGCSDCSLDRRVLGFRQ